MKPRRGVSLGAIAFLRACGVRLWGWMEKSQGRDAACAPMARSPADRKGIKNQGKKRSKAWWRSPFVILLTDISIFKNIWVKSQADEKPYLEIRLRYFFVRENHVACGSARAALFPRMALEKKPSFLLSPSPPAVGSVFRRKKKNLWTSRHGEVPESSTPLSVPHCAPRAARARPRSRTVARANRTRPRGTHASDAHVRRRRLDATPFPTPRPRSRPW